MRKKKRLLPRSRRPSKSPMLFSRMSPYTSEWVAQLNGDTNAEITPKVQGYLLSRKYQEGYPVKKDQLLFEIDPRPSAAALDQAKLNLQLRKPISPRQKPTWPAIHPWRPRTLSP